MIWPFRGGSGGILPPLLARVAREGFFAILMARYEHLPIYKQAMDVAVHFEKVVAGFSRYHKYTQNNNDKDNQNYGWAVRPGE